MTILEQATLAGDEVITTPIGDITLVDNYFDDDASQRLFDEMDYQRAAHCYIWSHPLVSMTTWRDRQTKAYGVTEDTDFVVLRSMKEKRGIVTGNLTTPYILNFISLKAGPLMVDYPVGKTAGGFLDFWHRPITDVGLTGPDQGKGARYVIVGPEDTTKPYEQPGTHVVQSATNNILFGVRILDPDPPFYVRFKAALKLGRVDQPLATSRFIEDQDIEWSATAPRGLAYWQVLSSIVNDEPVREVDKAWMAMLLPLGIEKGKPFQPDERQQRLLLKGCAMGELMARNLQVNPRFSAPYWKGTSWYKSFDFTIPQETETRVELDERTTWFYEAVTSSDGMVNPRVGAGQVYMTTKRDSQGRLLRADKTYRLRVPKDVPVGQFWSLTLYSENTRRPYDNGGTDTRSVNIDSNLTDLRANADGSIDLYVGANAPAGYEKNFMRTVGDDGWFVYFRLYAPLQPFFDKTFSLPDFEEVPTTQPLASKSHFDTMAKLPFVEGWPTKQTAQALRDELLYQRAAQVYLWALPLLNTLGMQLGSEQQFGAGYNVLPIWKQRLDARTLVTTPNSDILYAMSYVDLDRDGPLVMEAPPMLQGILLDYWQRPIPVDGGTFLGDVGLAGPDGGMGGKFLLLPPGYEGSVPTGYFVYRSATNHVFVFLRGSYEDPTDLTPAVAHLEQTKLYPLNGEAGAKPMSFPDASGVPINMLPLSDGSAFDHLKRLVDEEGDDLAGPDWLGMLAAIGIVQGKPFTPDAHTREILDLAAKTAYKTSRVLGFQEIVGGRSYRVYPDRRWINPFAEGTPATPWGALDPSWMNKAGYLALDARINFFTNYYSLSPGMLSYTVGKGANYMIAFTDSEGAPLLGGNHYRLRLPPEIPASNFWSVTLYEAENSSGLANGQAFPSIGSRDQPAQNADGSTDLFLGPRAPEGRQANWRATVPGRGYFAILRLYGPTETAVDRSWKPGDLERVK